MPSYSSSRSTDWLSEVKIPSRPRSQLSTSTFMLNVGKTVKPSGISGASTWYWPGKEGPGTYFL